MPTKNRRATHADIENRGTQLLDLLSKHPSTINEVGSAVGLNYATAAQELRRLEARGVVQRQKRDGRKLVYGLASYSGIGSMGGASPEPAPSSNTPTKSGRGADVSGGGPSPLPSVSINAILRQIHLGRELEVIGFHMEQGGEHPLVDLRSEDGELFTLALIDS